MLNRSATAGIMVEPVDWTIPAQPAISPRQDTKYGQPLGKRWEEARSGASRTRLMNRMEGGKHCSGEKNQL